jgi:phage/plasmid primase-like uncharacterized protein
MPALLYTALVRTMEPCQRALQAAAGPPRMSTSTRTKVCATCSTRNPVANTLICVPCLRQTTINRWPQILRSLAGLTDAELSDRHQPCPACGGRDRFRFDDRSGRGDFFCNGCGAGDGFALLQRINDWNFKKSAVEVAEFLRLGTATPPPSRPPQKPQAHVHVLRGTASYARDIWGRVERADAAVAAHPYCQRKGIGHAAGAGSSLVCCALLVQRS